MHTIGIMCKRTRREIWEKLMCYIWIWSLVHVSDLDFFHIFYSLTPIWLQLTPHVQCQVVSTAISGGICIGGFSAVQKIRYTFSIKVRWKPAKAHQIHKSTSSDQPFQIQYICYVCKSGTEGWVHPNHASGAMGDHMWCLGWPNFTQYGLTMALPKYKCTKKNKNGLELSQKQH